MLLSYPITLADDGFGTIYALCPDIPEAMTYAASREEASANMRAALEGAIELYRREGRPIPWPRKVKGDLSITIDAEDADIAPPPVRRGSIDAGPTSIGSRWRNYGLKPAR